MKDPKQYTRKIGGKNIEVTLNNWAEQASGSVLVRIGDTVVLATAVMNPTPREGGDFFPLTVEYEERYYATGKILGSRFMKRESRPSEEATLAARLIDRTIRPRFDMRMRNEVQVVLTVLAIDDQNDPDIAALSAASLALSLSDIPWQGPVAGVRIARKDGVLTINPTVEERTGAELDLVISGTRDRINMCEAGATEISEGDFAAVAEHGFAAIKELIALQDEIIAAHSREKKSVKLLPTPEEFAVLLRDEFMEDIEKAVYHHTSRAGVGDKKTAYAQKTAVKEKWMGRAAGRERP